MRTVSICDYIIARGVGMRALRVRVRASSVSLDELDLIYYDCTIDILSVCVPWNLSLRSTSYLSMPREHVSILTSSIRFDEIRSFTVLVLAKVHTYTWWLPTYTWHVHICLWKFCLHLMKQTFRENCIGFFMQLWYMHLYISRNIIGHKARKVYHKNRHNIKR